MILRIPYVYEFYDFTNSYVYEFYDFTNSYVYEFYVSALQNVMKLILCSCVLLVLL